MLCGLCTTFLIPETKRKTLEVAGEVPGTASNDPGSRSRTDKTGPISDSGGGEKVV